MRVREVCSSWTGRLAGALLLAVALMALWSGAVLAQDASNVQFMGKALEGCRNFGIDVDGHYAYVSAVDCGMFVLDISEPAHPTQVGRYWDARTNDVSVDGGLACVNEDYYGIHFVDVSDPAHPTKITSWSTILSGQYAAVLVSGQYIYATFQGQNPMTEEPILEFQVIDVSNRYDPYVVGRLALPEAGGKMAVSGDLVYVGTGSGLRVVDVSDAAQPRLVGFAAAPSGKFDLRMYGRYILASTEEALLVLDATDPVAPAVVTIWPCHGGPMDIAANYVYMAAGDDALRVISICDPTHPLEAGYYLIPGYGATDVAAYGQYPLVCSFLTGTLVLQFTGGQDPCPGAPYLYTIDDSNCDGAYLVHWDWPANPIACTIFTLEEDDNLSFLHPAVAYQGTQRMVQLVGRTAGKYYYRVRATNGFCAGPWSNARNVTVCSAVKTHTPALTRTPRPTPTPPEVPPEPTPSPTAASSASPTATATGGPPPQTITPTPTSVPLETLTPTPTPTYTPGPLLSVELQDGLEGYDGQEDAYISQSFSAENYCRSELLQVGMNQRNAALMRFDLSFIPAGSVVALANLEVYARGWSGGNLTLEAYRVLRRINMCEVTWGQAHAGENWSVAGCNYPGIDRAVAPEGRLTTAGVSRWYSWDLRALVQEWVAGTLPNNGVLLRSASPGSSHSLYFAGDQALTQSQRPKLRLYYYPAGGVPSTPSPTPTTPLSSTPTPTPASAPITLILQTGTDGYTGEEDTYIHEYSPAANYCTATTLRAGFKRQYATLLRFDLSRLPADARVTGARLRLYVTGWAGANTTMSVYRVLRSMQPCQATWERASMTEAWGLPGANDVVTDRGAAREDYQFVSGIGKWYEWGVTQLVSDALRGRQDARMLLMQDSPASTAEFYFASAQHATVALRPMLVVEYH